MQPFADREDEGQGRCRDNAAGRKAAPHGKPLKNRDWPIHTPSSSFNCKRHFGDRGFPVQAGSLSIGSLAKAAGVTTPPVRFYEEIGLLPPAGRTDSGQRAYGRDDLSRLTLIKQCRDFGFGIDQVRVLLDLSISTSRDCAETRDIAREHLSQVRKRLSELRELEKRLRVFVDRCEDICAGGPGQDCVILQEMASPPVKGCCQLPRIA